MSVTENLSAYIRDRQINLSELSRLSGIPYTNIYNSIAHQGRKRELRDWELLAICYALQIDPWKFYQKTN